jgi:apoptotic protease-activating factor
LILKLDILAVMPQLVSEGIVSLDEKEKIQSNTTGGEKVDALLTLLHRKAVSDSSIYERFLTVLADDFLSGGQHLEKLVSKIREDAVNPEVVRRYQAAPTRLDPKQKAALLSEEKQLVSSLNVEDILADLVSLGVLSLDENEVIRSGATYSEKAQRLVQLLLKKSAEQFVYFVETLVASESYSELGRRLLVEDVAMDTGISGGGENYVAEVLKRGHVPPRHSVYVDRPELTERIRKHLRQLQGTDGWVVVHGMAGFGKTILAAEAIRDASLLQDVFPGGVHWLPVGQMVTKDGEIDQAKLLTRLQNLIVRLDERVNRPPNLEAATNTLQKILSEQYPRSLLVLDDVWSPEVAQAFSVRCCTMVTSRNSAVASMVQAPHVIPVSITGGFSDDEGKLLLAQWLNREPSALPKDAELIIEYCRGSPMVIALIGAILKKNPTSERKWKVIVEKLKNRHFHSIKLHASVNEWSYQHATLNASIELSVESLPQHLQELFEMFSVFDYNTLVSSRALETIWSKDSLETEELLMELVGLSLVQKAPPSDEDSDYIVFIVHDIVLDYLHQNVPSNKQKEHHAAVVKHYSESEGAYADLPDDGYVYQKLLGHISAAGNYELLGDLLSQLSWLISTARSGNAISMLADYRLHKSKIPEQFQLGVQQFEFFMSGHMDILANHPSHDEIVQLALLQPNASEVFVQASMRARGDRKKSWFKWSNKESDPEKYVLKLKMHRAGVKKCQYSRDGTKILSCSNDSGIKLWDASTGMELADFRGHSDMVTCCALSNSGRLVVSSSEDNTVRVWDTHRKNSIAPGNERVKKSSLILEFKGHQYGVQCCAITPGEDLVMSADIDSCVMVWESLTGKVVSRWRLSYTSPIVSPILMEGQPSFPPVHLPLRPNSPTLGTEGVLSCAFSPDGSMAVTGTQTGSVYVSVRACMYVQHVHIYVHVQHIRIDMDMLGLFPCLFTSLPSSFGKQIVNYWALLWDTSLKSVAVCLTRLEASWPLLAQGTLLQRSGQYLPEIVFTPCPIAVQYCRVTSLLIRRDLSLETQTVLLLCGPCQLALNWRSICCTPTM